MPLLLLLKVPKQPYRSHLKHTTVGRVDRKRISPQAPIYLKPAKARLPANKTMSIFICMAAT